ncbi:MAG TPA: hypothetical protein VGG64_18040 [Pirellulales bacterium]
MVAVAVVVDAAAGEEVVAAVEVEACVAAADFRHPLHVPVQAPGRTREEVNGPPRDLAVRRAQKQQPGRPREQKQVSDLVALKRARLPVQDSVPAPRAEWQIAPRAVDHPRVS